MSGAQIELTAMWGHDGRDAQFRLARLQSFNWGTFSGVSDLAIPDAGYLLVGPSGSGKSTLLDAHAAILTPPKWVDFNVAAREAERAGKDRNLISYVRGAWAQQTGDGGEHTVQYLRGGTTWSALAETYRQADLDKTVVLAQVLWVRGSATSSAEVKRLYLVFERAFDVRELEFFAKSDFDVRRLKHGLPDAFVRDEFSAYQERFRRLLGIDSERALRLLHKTQSAKNLGDLNVFLRDFMLDPPETFATAQRLVSEFGELHAAHQAVVTAREQIETLGPARELHAELQRCRSEKASLDALAAALDGYREQRRSELLGARIAELDVAAEGTRQEASRLADAVNDEFDRLSQLRLKRDGLGGTLNQLRQQQQAAQAEEALRRSKRERVIEACRVLQWQLPEDAHAFVAMAADAKDRLAGAHDRAVELVHARDALKRKQDEAEREFRDTCAEIQAMERQPSNVPAHMLEVRAQIARALGLGEDRLPFVGELLEVKPEAAAWQGAIERVLHNFALSLLVDDRDYAAVASYVNAQHFGQRVVYFRVLPHEPLRRRPGPNSLVRKLAIAQVEHAGWLRDELAERFDYECAERVQAFRNAARAVTQHGQVKHSHARHEKDDRTRIDDRRRWVLGFDNRDKLALYKQRAGELAAELSQLQAQLQGLEQRGERHTRELLQCQTLCNLTWAEVDLASLLARIASLAQQIAVETAARPELAALDAQIESQDARHRRAVKAHQAEELRRQALEQERAKHARTLLELTNDAPAFDADAEQVRALEARFSAASKPLALDTLDAMSREVERRIAEEQKALLVRGSELGHRIEKQFATFNQRWPADGGGLDAVLASAGDYFAKLTRLETDGLPKYEERFFTLLREQSDQNLTLLATRLDLERAAIRERLELVNESLLTAPFNPGTHLVIDPMDRALEEVRQFKSQLKEALSHSFSSDRQQAERRFAVLSALVSRLSSQDSADRSWRNLVLDVRQHVEFVARELDDNDEEVEIYRSGAGKSGGQRQKLAATCLAAALRYQLGGQDRALPRFATVALDEAFDKADAEFTAMAMNIFKTFGFQMLIATPLKSVMTLEPFIGGACFVHIKDRKHSATLVIDYDADEKRLVLPERIADGQEAALS